MGTACLGCCEYNNIFSKKHKDLQSDRFIFCGFLATPLQKRKRRTAFYCDSPLPKYLLSLRQKTIV